jgi:thiamine biosynthesis lipoprotein
MQQPNRRRFLVLAAGGLSTGALGVAAWRQNLHELETVRRRGFALGTQVSIIARHHSRGAASGAIDKAFAELELVEELMSIYRPDSQVSELNRTGRLENPHPYLIDVLRHAMVVSHQTHGAFDITVQPLWEVFSAAARQRTLPSRETIAAARRQVDWTNVDSRPHCVRLHRPSTAITLNGIAQGFATDRVLTVLRDAGIEHALINAGEYASLGESDRADDWTIGIQHPRHEDAFIALADLQGRCLATSGDYASTFTPDRAYNHIFDPRTGYSPRELASVSILAPSAMQADALSTALFVLGPDRGIELVSQLPNTDAFFVLKDGSTMVTPGFSLTEEGRAV